MANECYTRAIIESCSEEKLKELMETIKVIAGKLYEQYIVPTQNQTIFKATILAMGFAAHFSDKVFIFENEELAQVDSASSVVLDGIAKSWDFDCSGQVVKLVIETESEPPVNLMYRLEEYLEGDLSFVIRNSDLELYEKHGDYYSEFLHVASYIGNEYATYFFGDLEEFLEWLLDEISAEPMLQPYKKLLQNISIKDFDNIEPITEKIDDILTNTHTGYLVLHKYLEV